MRAKTIFCAALMFALAFPVCASSADLNDRVEALGRAKTRKERYDIVKELREKGVDARESLLAGLKSENGIVRAESLRLLSELKNDADLDSILKMISDSEKFVSVRVAAINALRMYPKADAKIRTHLLGRYQVKTISEAERIALLDGLKLVADASLVAPMQETLIPGIPAVEAVGIIAVLGAVPNHAGGAALAAFLDQKEEKKPADDKPDGDKPDGDKPDGDKPDGDKPDGDKPDGDKSDGDKPDGDKPDGDKPDDKPVVKKPDVPAKWAFLPIGNVDKSSWDAVRARAIMALATSKSPEGIRFIVEGFELNFYSSSAAEAPLANLSENYSAEQVLPELVKILEDSTKVSQYRRVLAMMAPFGKPSMDAVLKLLDDSVKVQQADIAAAKAKGQEDPKIAIKFEPHFRTACAEFAKTTEGRSALVNGYVDRAKAAIEDDVAPAMMLKAALPIRIGPNDHPDEAGKTAVLVALDSADADIVELGIKDWMHYRGRQDSILMVDRVLANKAEDVDGNEKLYKTLFENFSRSLQRTAKVVGEREVSRLKELVDPKKETRANVRAGAWSCFVYLEEPTLLDTFNVGFVDTDPAAAAAAGMAFSGFCQNLSLSDKKRSDLKAQASRILYSAFKPEEGAPEHMGAAVGVIERLDTTITSIYGTYSPADPEQAAVIKTANELMDSDKPYLQRSALSMTPRFRGEDFAKKALKIFEETKNPFVAEKAAAIVSQDLRNMETDGQRKVLKAALSWMATASDEKADAHGMISNLDAQSRVATEAGNIVAALGNKNSGLMKTGTGTAILEEIKRYQAELDAAADGAAAKPALVFLANIATFERNNSQGERLELYIQTLAKIDDKKHREASTNYYGTLSQSAQSYIAEFATREQLPELEKIQVLKGRVRSIRTRIENREKEAARKAADPTGAGK